MAVGEVPAQLPYVDPIKIAECSEKGKIVIGTKNLVAGELCLYEDSLVRIGRGRDDVEAVYKHFNALPLDRRKAVLNLYHPEPDSAAVSMLS